MIGLDWPPKMGLLLHQDFWFHQTAGLAILHFPCITWKQVDETILCFTSFQMRSSKLTPKPTFYTPKTKGMQSFSFWEVLNITFQKGLQYMMGWSTCVRYESNAWKKFQKSSPKWLFHGDESHDTLCEEITFSQSQVLQNSWWLEFSSKKVRFVVLRITY